MSVELLNRDHAQFGAKNAQFKQVVPFQDNIAAMNKVSTKFIINATAPDLFVRVPTGQLAGAATSRAKRIVDFTLALLGLIFLLPLFAVLCAIIMITSKGGPFYRQVRTGLAGRQFKIWKFRTMSVCECGYNMTQAARDDARVTNFGKWLRRTSIDELPQLINVIRGEMSLIGPRPHAIAHDIHFGTLINEYCERFRVRPGISGLAQVSGARGPTPSISVMARRVKFDLEYLNNWSLWLDLKIFLKTITTIFGHDAF